MDNKFKINNINIKGFKSIDSEGQNIPIDDINILLGANGVGNELFISQEEIDFSDGAHLFGQRRISVNNASLESNIFLKTIIDSNFPIKSVNFLDNFRSFQFNDTSKESKIRSSVYIQDSKALHSDGGNLAAFLYVMKKHSESEKYYQSGKRRRKERI